MTAYDVAEIIEQATRRELALKGSLVTTRNPKAYVGPRPDAVSPLDRPEIRWPSERHLVPERCWHCQAGRLNFDIDAPYGLRKDGEVTCRSCSRVQVRLKADGTRRLTAEEFAALPVGKGKPGSIDHRLCGPGMWCSSCRTRIWRERQQAGVTP